MIPGVWRIVSSVVWRIAGHDVIEGPLPRVPSYKEFFECTARFSWREKISTDVVQSFYTVIMYVDVSAIMSLFLR